MAGSRTTGTRTRRSTKPSDVQKYFVLGNKGVLSVAELAAKTGLTEGQVEAIIEGEPKPSGPTPFEDSLHKPRPGIFAMTEASSQLADDAKYNKQVGEDEINAAAASGNHKLAADLARLRAEGKTDPAKQRLARNSDRWHVIDPKRPQ